MALRQGQLEEAVDLLRECVPIAHDQFNLEYLAEGLTQVAAVAVRQCQYDRGAVVLGGSEALLEGAGGAREPVWHELHEETVSLLQRELGDRLAVPRQEGRAMSADELVACALQFLDSTSA